MAEPPIAVSSITAQAFRLAELGPISSFGDDSEQAREAAAQYPVALALCLEACDWSFASAMAQLSPVLAAEAPAVDPRLPTLYRLPAACIRVREVLPEGTPWRIDRSWLRAAASGPLTLRFTERLSDEAALPASFQVAVAYQLAVLFSARWMPVRTKRADLKADLAEALAAARRADARSAAPGRWDGGATGTDWVAEAMR